MDTLNIALLQIAPTDTNDGNLAKGIAACERAAELGADLALFPEMWSCGYDFDVPSERVFAYRAVGEKSAFVQSFAKLARRLEMAIAITFLEKTRAKPKNTVIVFDRFGKRVLKYSKVHAVDCGMELYTEPGDSFNVGTLDYGHGRVKIGAMICFDRNFPESARILMLNGAEIILAPNACEILAAHVAIMKARAIENHVALITVNYPVEAGSTYKGNGYSNAQSPIFRTKVKTDDGASEISSAIIQMGPREEIAVAEVDIDSLRKNRASGGNGNAFRKPRMYKKLLDEKVAPPFVRKNARR